MSPNKENETIVNPNDNLQIPDWIRKDLFESSLQNDLPGFSKIARFVPMAAIGPGENYTSRMLRVYIDVELKDGSTVQTSYVVKTAIESEQTQKFMNSINAFPKEKEIYETILPKYEQLYAEVGKKVRFGPSCKYVQDSPEHMTIIMEDLKRRNFANVDRLECLDMDHITAVLGKLAEFHAASAVDFEKSGPLPEYMRKSFFTEEFRDMFKKFGCGHAEWFTAILPKWGDCDKYIKLWPDGDKVFDWFIQSTIPDPNEFNVLNHGDCWSNNIMFQHDAEGKITETYFVDYQITQWGTPAQDLWYLITASAQYDLRVRDFDLLMRIYQEHLAKSLELLNYSKPIPSLKDIHVMMIKNSLWGFYAATAVLAAVLAEPAENANCDNLTNEDEAGEEFRQQILLNPRFVKVMKQLLPWWENRGLFQL